MALYLRLPIGFLGQCLLDVPYLVHYGDFEYHCDEDILIGPITRARTKLINQQVNSLLNDFNLTNKNMLLPNSSMFCLYSYTHIKAYETEHNGARSIIQKLW